jgi:hypothetical protein
MKRLEAQINLNKSNLLRKLLKNQRKSDVELLDYFKDNDFILKPRQYFQI